MKHIVNANPDTMAHLELNGIATTTVMVSPLTVVLLLLATYFASMPALALVALANIAVAGAAYWYTCWFCDHYRGWSEPMAK